MRRFIPKPVKLFVKRLISFVTWDQWAERSWSQEGEDRVLRRIFDRQAKGFYVDVGAYHPKHLSNTYLFYKLGWRGINIDAMPGSMSAFKKHRPRDINLELGVGELESKLDYYVFNETTLNSFSRSLSLERHESASAQKINSVIKVDVVPLSIILDRHLPSGQVIDFMNVDVEGLDYEVLMSNNWTKYRPTYVLAENYGSSMHEIEKSDIGQLMINQGYSLYAKCKYTIFFKDTLPK